MSSARKLSSDIERLATFYVDKEMFGLEVTKVQEVTGHPNVYEVPLAPAFVRGLVNLRGQIATALGLREVFSKTSEVKESQVSVICKVDGNLTSLIVDEICDVVEVDTKTFEAVPDTVPHQVRRFIKGIYKMNGVLLSVLDLDALAKEISPDNEATSPRSNQ